MPIVATSTPRPTPLILVADDNEGNRALAKAALESVGYDTVLVSDGAEAVAAFTSREPDCILLDVRMPILDGFGACRQIRSLPKGTETPILFLTALRDIDTFDQALEAGGDDFITKPVRPTELIVRIQNALKLRNLNVELRDHYELLKRQRDDLLRLQLQKERLMAFVVHDLKNPVNSIDLHAQLLSRDGGLPDSARESAAAIRGETRQLSRMILNLLDLAKGEEGKLVVNRTPVNLEALVGSVVKELEVVAHKRQTKLATSIHGAKVSADEDLLRRTLANLVENAIRHAPPETSIEVTVRSVAAQGDSPESVELRVSDRGAGVPVELRERVFEPFAQLDFVEKTGRGLGLAFCKTAVAAHGGRIWIEDGEPQGAVFCIRLPHVSASS